MKTKFFFMVTLLSVLSICNIAYPQAATQHEELTLTTYYPAPYGDYVELTVSGNAASPALDITPTLTAAANNDILTALNINPTFNDLGWFNVRHNGLIVQNGNVGIGTTSPTAKLHVAGTAGTDGIKFPDGSLQKRATNIDSDIRGTYIETTSDTNWTDLAVVNLPAGFSGGKAYITFTAPIAKDGAFKVRLTLDGNSLVTTPSIDLVPGLNYLAGAIRGAPVTLTYLVSNLAAGAHSIKAQWRGDTIAGPNENLPAYAIIEAGSARVLTVITGQ